MEKQSPSENSTTKKRKHCHWTRIRKYSEWKKLCLFQNGIFSGDRAKYGRIWSKTSSYCNNISRRRHDSEKIFQTRHSRFTWIFTPASILPLDVAPMCFSLFQAPRTNEYQKCGKTLGVFRFLNSPNETGIGIWCWFASDKHSLGSCFKEKHAN